MSITNLDAGVHDFQLHQSDTWRTVIRLNVNDEDLTPIDLSAADIKIQVRKRVGSEVLLELTIGDGLTIQGTDDNEILIHTDDITFSGSYRYELQYIIGGVTKTPLKGHLFISKDLTTD